MNNQLGITEVKWLLGGMGLIFLGIVAFLVITTNNLRRSLTRSTGKVVGTFFRREARVYVPVVETQWNGETVRLQAESVPREFLNSCQGQEVPIWLGNRAGKLSGMPKCFIETGRKSALPGLLKLLPFIVIFSLVGIVMLLAAFLIHE